MSITQDQLQAVLKQRLEKNRLPSVLLFQGSNESLLQKQSEWLAQLLLNNNNLNQQGDYLCIRPQGKSRRISVENARDLVLFSQKTALHHAHKVIVIAEADRLHLSAANILLKTLEDNKNLFLVLWTTKAWELLPTIISRCIPFRMNFASDALDNPKWNAWKQDFLNWFQDLPQSKRSQAHFSANGLLLQFLSLHKTFVQESIKTQDCSFLSEEEKEAFISGIEKKTTLRLLKEIQVLLRQQTLSSLLQRASDLLFISAYTQQMLTCEKVEKLLNLNLSLPNALEFLWLRLMGQK